MIIHSFTVNRSKKIFVTGISRKKSQRKKIGDIFFPLVAHRSIADEGIPSFLLNSGNFLVISLRFLSRISSSFLISWHQENRVCLGRELPLSWNSRAHENLKFC
jgi:hypothetical protein